MYITNLLIKVGDGRIAVFKGPYFIANLLVAHTSCSIQQDVRQWSFNACHNLTRCILNQFECLARGINRFQVWTIYWVTEEDVLVCRKETRVLSERDLNKLLQVKKKTTATRVLSFQNCVVGLTCTLSDHSWHRFCKFEDPFKKFSRGLAYIRA